jgi:hydroxymethylpyrimidine pyrophosphatase-like HAD family hydrolase
VRPLDQLSAEEARGLSGVVFDLDDTVLDHGALTEPAYGALFRLREAGLRRIACTGRPAGWGEIVQRQWPVDATVTENGAVAWVREAKTGRAVIVDGVSPAIRSARRQALRGMAEAIVARFPETGLADDNGARVTDVTLDIGEHRRVSRDVVEAMHTMARARGVRSFHSSVHLHLTFETEDKASGTIGLISRHFGEDPTAARARYAFVGDSANDGAAFGAFLTTFGVANVAAHLGGISVAPRYVALEPMGRGFAAIASRLAALRASGPG